MHTVLGIHFSSTNTEYIIVEDGGAYSKIYKKKKK